LTLCEFGVVGGVGRASGGVELDVLFQPFRSVFADRFQRQEPGLSGAATSLLDGLTFKPTKTDRNQTDDAIKPPLLEKPPSFISTSPTPCGSSVGRTKPDLAIVVTSSSGPPHRAGQRSKAFSETLHGSSA
jgi:hypothetical protein